MSTQSVIFFNFYQENIDIFIAEQVLEILLDNIFEVCKFEGTKNPFGMKGRWEPNHLHVIGSHHSKTISLRQPLWSTYAERILRCCETLSR